MSDKVAQDQRPDKRRAVARLRYFAEKGKRDPKSLTIAELDELCSIVATFVTKPERA